MFNTKYFIKCSSKYPSSSYLLYFLNELKLSLTKNHCCWLSCRWQIWSFMSTALSPRNFTVSCDWISLSKTSTYMIRKIGFFVKNEKTNILILEVMIKNLCCWFWTKTQSSFLAVVIAPVTFFILPSYSLYSQVMLISILINVQYLKNIVFSFEKGLLVKITPCQIPITQ